MSNALERVKKEMSNVFADPKFARHAWKSVGQAILQNPAIVPVHQYDKEGNETFASQIESYSYDRLARDIKQLGNENRAPTELEMIMQCQIVKARYDTAAAVFVRDTLGAKPVDETKLDAQVNNPYEQLSDEELELIANMREQKLKEAEKLALQSKEETDDASRRDSADDRGTTGDVPVRDDGQPGE